MVLSGTDISHWQGRPDLAAFKAAGGAFVIAKATDGTGYTDPQFATTRSDAHAAGLVVGAYHFAEWGNVAAEAAHFLSIVPRPGELLGLDAEAAVPAGVDVAAWSAEFSRLVHVATGAYPFIYMNQSWEAGHNWAAVSATDGLWLAKYDNSTASVPTPGWPTLAMKQYTSTGTEAGVAGQVDLDEFYGDLPTLLRYAVPGATPTPPPTPPPSPAPTPTPTPKEPDLLPDERAALMDVHGWLQGVKNSGNPNGYDNVTLIWAQTRDALADLVALKAQVTALQAQVTALQAAPPGTAAIVAALDADLAARFGPKA